MTDCQTICHTRYIAPLYNRRCPSRVDPRPLAVQALTPEAASPQVAAHPPQRTTTACTSPPTAAHRPGRPRHSARLRRLSGRCRHPGIGSRPSTAAPELAPCLGTGAPCPAWRVGCGTRRPQARARLCGAWWRPWHPGRLPEWRPHTSASPRACRLSRSASGVAVPCHGVDRAPQSTAAPRVP